jgi:anthranilate 1,2-dioxygenase small subunit/terephthalate 1,2-dioxygenase oxygenase component beta subunit
VAGPERATDLLLQVQDLNARYVQAIDDNKLEVWPDFFVEQCRYIITTADNFERGLPLGMIYATSRAMLRDRVKSLRDANVYEAQRYRHVIGPPVIEQAKEEATVRAQTNFIVARIMHTGETVIFATGRYNDRIKLDGPDGPRFVEKTVVLDSRIIDTLLAIPL